MNFAAIAALTRAKPHGVQLTPSACSIADLKNANAPKTMKRYDAIKKNSFNSLSALSRTAVFEGNVALTVAPP
jgi:hypothetical protein